MIRIPFGGGYFRFSHGVGFNNKGIPEVLDGNSNSLFYCSSACMCFLSLRACLAVFGFLVTKANPLMGGRPLRIVQAGRGPE